jgi:hypothetical protein
MTTTKKGRNTAEAAAYLGIAKSTLEHHRSNGTGPRYSQDSREITYEDPDLDEWKESRKISSRAEYLARKRSEKGPKLSPAAPKPHPPKPRKRQLKPRTPPDSNNSHSLLDQAQ